MTAAPHPLFFVRRRSNGQCIAREHLRTGEADHAMTTPRLGTRTLDVLHVVSALALQADTFYTFDTRQAKLAAAEGLLFR